MSRAVLASLSLAAAATVVSLSPAVSSAPRDTRPLVLHVGDSFVGAGFAPALKSRFDKIGVAYKSTAFTAAYTTTLIRQVKLDSLITTLKPRLVIVTIGANELAMPVPEQHAHAVKNITKLISQVPCVWALPPRWNDKEAGILAIMKREAGPCRVHDPAAIERDIPRGPDKIHPSDKGGAMWADHFFKWLMAGKAEGQMPWDPPAAPPEKEAAK
ncbi:MAG: SGNH/GDSL hydrolase family protein [Polyangiaceae bacterium]|nr:SGNH/GDSL hydrolase family protein [Polyangiaceae bacterium]